MGRRGASILALLLALASCNAQTPARDVRLVLLVSVDTLRADHLGVHGSDRGITPHLDALAAESVVFSAAYAPSSHTLPSVAALLTGRYPEELGIWSNAAVLPSGTPTLASRFRDSGWHTAAVVSNWVARATSGLDAGFEHFDDALPQLEATRPIPERIAGDTTDAALRSADACLPDPAARCLLWVHYQDPHGPYTPPGDQRARLLARERAAPDGRRELPALERNFGSGGIPYYQQLDDQREVAFYRAGYAGEVAYLDQEVGRLLEGLGARKLLEETLVVFTADHGESLGEDDHWFGHGALLNDPQVRVPLWLRVPGAPAGRRNDSASLVDVLPTLAERLLEPDLTADTAGRPLLAPGAENAEATLYLATLRGGKTQRIGIVDADFKYVAELREGVWDGRLVKRDDESVDLTAPAPHVAARLRGRLDELRQRYHRTDRESLPELSQEDREKLEALGYLDPTPEPGL